jgi:hypothetical protein
MALFARMFGHCRTPADYYQACIESDNDFVPHEVAELWGGREAFPADAPPEIMRTLERNTALMYLMRPQLREYTRSFLAEQVLFFEDVALPADVPRFLMVCFSGNAKRMMLPTAALLQHLPREPVDVVMLRDPSQLNYLRGVPGYAGDIHQACGRLRRDLDFARYDTVVTLGTSGGGAGALYGGIFLGASASLSVGGHHPTQAKRALARAGSLGITGEEFDELAREHATARRPAMFAAYAESHDADRAGALALAARLPGCTPVPVGGLDTHAVMMALCTRRRLSRVLDRFLFGQAAGTDHGPAD